MNPAPDDTPWYCLRAQPKREGVAAQQLATLDGVTVFHPRVRYTRRTKKGPVVTMEPLFPGYLFAAFDFFSLGKQVGYTRGVARIVRRASLDPVEVPATVMRGIFELAPGGVVRVGDPEFRPGDAVRVVSGIFAGADTTVVRLEPATRRVAVLIALLGDTREVLLRPDELDLPQADPRRRL